MWTVSSLVAEGFFFSSLPGVSGVGWADGAGRMYSFARAATNWVTTGATPWRRAASQACGVMVISAEPQRVAL